MNNLFPIDTRDTESRLLLPARSHLPSIRSRQTRYHPGRNRQPGTLVGNTPVLWIPGTSDQIGTADRGYWAKLEGFNPGGMKDRPAMHMVERARARGELAPGAVIVESTSGTLGLGLALAGQVYPVSPWSPTPVWNRSLRVC
jgi:cysteine synthase A